MTLCALMLAVFTVSLGYGIVVPLLPYLIERFLGTAASSQTIARDTGLLTAAYALALFLFAPAWGRLSDQRGRRSVLLVGLCGFGVTTLLFSLVENRIAVYGERFLSGAFAAAVTPVASAVAADLARSDEGRGRRLAIVSAAGTTGVLLGPSIGVLATRIVRGFTGSAGAGATLAIPLVLTGVVALLAAGAVALTVRHTPGGRKPVVHAALAGGGRRIVFRLLVLAFAVSAAIGSFHVGLALRGKQELALTSYQVAMMFTECSAVMLVAQAVVFSPIVKAAATRWLVLPSLVVLAAGLLVVPFAGSYSWMLFAVGAVGTSAGVAAPVITYWISTRAGRARGAELGKQTAASSLGQTIGAAAGGLLFSVTASPSLLFQVIAAVVVAGALLAVGVPKLLGRAPAHDPSVVSAP